MRQGHSSDVAKEHENGPYYFGNKAIMELTEYMFIPDQGLWRGYLKGYPACQAYGESFEELQLKLHQLHPDLSVSTSSSVCSNAVLLCWDRQRRISRIP